MHIETPTHQTTDEPMLGQFVDELQVFQALIQQFAIGIFVVDGRGVIEFANAMAQTLCVGTPTQLIGKNCVELLAQELTQAQVRDMGNSLVNKQVWAVETLIQRMDGTRFWGDFKLVPFPTAVPGTTRWCMFLHDISHLKHAAENFHRPRSFDQLTLQAELRNAIFNGELRLTYQPQISLHSGKIIGLEALVRWEHPTRGLLTPFHFIALAEECGLVIALDEWVMRTAILQIGLWRDEGLAPVRVAVNLSAQHFMQKDLPDAIQALLQNHAVPAALIEVELTESVMMYDAEAAIRFVNRLKALGIRVSVDDFGTGYSSLAYLSRFAIDVIKIDQSIVVDITTNPVNATIATATIAMAHKFGKTVVAEGVETEEQMIYLRRHECDEMQGYLFSRPVGPEAISEMLRSGAGISLGLDQSVTAQMTLLLVDDEPYILNAIKRLMRREGYRILCAESAAQGLDLLATNHVHVVISDQRMPVMTGTEFLSLVKDLYPNTVRLILSGYSEPMSLTDAINKGAVYRYLSKPWDDEELKREVTQAFRYYRERNPTLDSNGDGHETV